jgi:hypothetical protein
MTHVQRWRSKGTHALGVWRALRGHYVALAVALPCLLPLPLPVALPSGARRRRRAVARGAKGVAASGTPYPWGVTPRELDPPTRLFRQLGLGHGCRLDRVNEGEGGPALSRCVEEAADGGCGIVELEING